jgi:hypothetical protein
MAAGSGLQIEIDQSTIDFGIVPRHACRERVLHVSNRGGQPVRFLATDSDCTCLDSELGVRRLEPGQSAEWRIVLDTCDYTGEVRRHVWVNSDTRDAARVKVAVRYRVVDELFTRPSFVALGLIGDEPIEALVQVETCNEGSFELVAASSSDPQVEVLIGRECVTRDEPGRVRVCVYGPVPEGRFRPVVWVDTTSSSVPRLRIPVFGESVCGLGCNSRRIVLGEIPLRTSHTKTVTFSCEPGVRVGGIRTSNETLDVTAIDRKNGTIVVTLESNTRLPLGEFRGYLILEVNNGQARKVKLPYRGRVVEPPKTRSPTRR